ncbi:MAG: hypothetical protein ACJAVV_002459 [Alphaproteobacteria bacterium]|jgi:uncharacterized protein
MDVSNYLYTDLSVLYDNPEQAQFLQSQSYVEGCLLGACACPEIPLPDVWLPWVIKHHQQIQNAQQADHITDVLFAFFKQCLAHMHNNSLSLPAYAVYSDISAKPLRDWCEGILVAHSAREKFWQGAWNKMQAQSPQNAPQLAKDLKHCLLMFTTFADPEKAIEEANSKDGSGALLAQKLPVIAKSLQDTLQKYVAISGELAAFLPNQFETFQQDND